MAKNEETVQKFDLRALLTDEQIEEFESLTEEQLLEASTMTNTEMNIRAYSPEVRRNAIRLLIQHRLNWNKVQALTGIDRKTLQQWFKQNRIELGFDLKEELENIAFVLVQEMPKFNNGKDWAIALGIIIEKLALLNGMKSNDVGAGNTTIQNLNMNVANMLGIDPANVSQLLKQNQALLEQMKQEQKQLEDKNGKSLSEEVEITVEPKPL